MAKKPGPKKKDSRKKQDMWEREFEDISSFSPGAMERRPQPVQGSRSSRQREEWQPARQIRPDRSSRPPEPGGPVRQTRPARQPVRRPAPDWEIPEWELNSRRRPPAEERTSSTRQRRPASPERRPPPASKKRPGKKGKSGVGRVVKFLLVLTMTAATAFFAVFLLFKISVIEITGDTIEGYGENEILKISDCKPGDNLVFLPTGNAENTLKQEIPYIEDVKFIRHLPNTLEIRLTAAKVAACVSCDNGWLYVNGEGKILENQAVPRDGMLQILGLTPLDTEPGAYLRLEDSDAQTACDSILKTVADLEMTQDFTRVDISDLSDIRLVYQDRIEFQLGNILKLDYKIELGCRALEELGAGKKGIMNLAYADETKRAVFTSGDIGLAPAQTPAPSAAPKDGNVSSAPGPSGDDGDTSSGGDTGDGDTDTGDGDGEDSSTNYRTDGIPDEIFTGE